jgi:hypothetical protein
LYRQVSHHPRTGILLRAGEHLVDLLQDADGEPDPALALEVLAFLDAAEASGTAALAAHCVALRGLTRNRSVARRAATVARHLLASGE